LLNLAGIESPGLTAAPAMARMAASLLEQAGLELRPRGEFNAVREGRPRLVEMTLVERSALIERDPRYGRIVCRCEGVSEGEIVAATRGPLPAQTLDAVKKRTRAMAGRCQGGFDMPLIVEIVAREVGIEPWQVSKSGPGSKVLAGLTKERLAEEAAW
jgi:glycerol-3-phosphate dehydrogenase